MEKKHFTKKKHIIEKKYFRKEDINRVEIYITD